MGARQRWLIMPSSVNYATWVPWNRHYTTANMLIVHTWTFLKNLFYTFDNLKISETSHNKLILIYNI